MGTESDPNSIEFYQFRTIPLAAFATKWYFFYFSVTIQHHDFVQPSANAVCLEVRAHFRREPSRP